MAKTAEERRTKRRDRREDRQKRRAAQVFGYDVQDATRQAYAAGEKDAAKITAAFMEGGPKRYGSLWAIFAPILEAVVKQLVEAMLKRLTETTPATT